MSFGGPYSELNKRMRESREESKRRRERRNKFKESAGIQSASSEQNPFERKFSEKDKQAFLQELKAERLNNRLKGFLALLISLAIASAIVWFIFF